MSPRLHAPGMNHGRSHGGVAHWQRYLNGVSYASKLESPGPTPGRRSRRTRSLNLVTRQAGAGFSRARTAVGLGKLRLVAQCHPGPWHPAVVAATAARSRRHAWQLTRQSTARRPPPPPPKPLLQPQLRRSDHASHGAATSVWLHPLPGVAVNQPNRVRAARVVSVRSVPRRPTRQISSPRGQPPASAQRAAPPPPNPARGRAGGRTVRQHPRQAPSN